MKTRYGPSANIIPFLGARGAGPVAEATVGEFVDYIVMILTTRLPAAQMVLP